MGELQEKTKAHYGLTISYKKDVLEYILSNFPKKEGARGLKKWLELLHKKIEDLALLVDVQRAEAHFTVQKKDLLLRFNQQEIIVFEPINEEEKQKEIEKSFDQIIGLEEVKEKIRSYQALFLAQRRRLEQGLAVKPISMHMLFMGNPGTGKTMIARLFAQYLKNIGLLKQ